MVQKTREKGNCIPFSGVSGEIVEFDIGDGAVFRIQWFEHWEEFVLAEHRRTAERMRTAFDNGGNSAKAAIYGAMVERYLKLNELPSLTRQHKIALAALYFGGGDQSEYGGMGAYYHIYSNPHAADAPKGGLLFYPSERADHALGTHDFQILNLREFNRKQGVHPIQVERLDYAQVQRDAALSVFPPNWRSLGKFISLERILVDRAILFVEAGAVSKLGDYLVTDGIKLFYQAYCSFTPAAKVQTLFTREAAFGNKVTDEQYWLNVVDVTLEFVTLGFSTNEATSPFRYYNTGTRDKLISVRPVWQIFRAVVSVLSGLEW